MDKDSYVYIDHILLTGELMGGGGLSMAYHSLCYQLMDATEVNSVIQGIAEESQEDAQQLQDDI